MRTLKIVLLALVAFVVIGFMPIFRPAATPSDYDRELAKIESDLAAPYIGNHAEAVVLVLGNRRVSNGASSRSRALAAAASAGWTPGSWSSQSCECSCALD